MFSKSYSKKFILSMFISLGAALLFISGPIFAQTPPSTGQEQKTDVAIHNQGTGDWYNDFDNDVQQGKDELQKNPEAQRHQKEVVDGEDGTAGEGDGENNQEGVDEHGDIQQAENNQGVNEDNQDINNSGIDEVKDANNLDEQSQEVINEHQVQEEGEVKNEQQDGNEQQGGNETSGQATSTQEGGSGSEQNQSEKNNNQ